MAGLQEIEPVPNKEDDACAFCSKNRGVLPIGDEQHNEYWICEACDKDMDWE